MQGLLNENNPLIEGNFFFNSVLTKLFLYEGRIRFCNQKVQCTFIINLDFSFDIFQQDNCWVLSIFSPEPLKFLSLFELKEWETYLMKQIKRQRFHQFFSGIRKLGKGNFASVYLTQRLYDNRQFAVKAFQKQATFKLINGKQSLQNEINILRRFDHPNLSKLQSVYESENSIYLVMQLILGRNLADILTEQKIIKLPERRKIIKGILEGLAQMESKNIVHRDLKPENIMIDHQGEPKIIDFGLATDVRSQKYIFIRCGTPGYVAPQILNIKDLGKARMNSISDIFSVGAIFYYMIFGKQLFEGQKNSEIVEINRCCSFSIPVHSDLSSKEQLFLLRRMLDVFPQTRITASQSLKLSYFEQNKRQPLQQINNSYPNNQNYNHPNNKHLPPLKYPHNSHMQRRLREEGNSQN